MADLKMVWCGDVGHPCFVDILTRLDNVVSVVPLAVLESHSLDFSPHVIVLAQSYRGQFSQDLVERIWTHYPLAAIVNLLSSECEGDRRAGSALRGVTRVFWYHWAHEWQRVVSHWNRFRDTPWHLPRTVTDADRASCWVDDPADQSAQLSGQAIAVWGAGDGDANCLDDAVRAIGGTPLAQSIPRDATESPTVSPALCAVGVPHERVANKDLAEVGPDPRPVVLSCIDATAVNEAFWQTFRLACSRFPAAPVLVTLGFPRPQDERQLLASGISEIVAKPFPLHVFQQAVLRLLGSQASIAGDAPASAHQTDRETHSRALGDLASPDAETSAPAA